MEFKKWSRKKKSNRALVMGSFSNIQQRWKYIGFWKSRLNNKNLEY